MHAFTSPLHLRFPCGRSRPPEEGGFLFPWVVSEQVSRLCPPRPQDSHVTSAGPKSLLLFQSSPGSPTGWPKPRLLTHHICCALIAASFHLGARGTPPSGGSPHTRASLVEEKAHKGKELGYCFPFTRRAVLCKVDTQFIISKYPEKIPMTLLH